MSVNIRQLAEILGISVSSVSKALSGYQDISPQTRQRVLDAAKKYGYSPNRAAQQLKSGRTKTIGIVLPRYSEGFSEPFFWEMLGGIGEGAISTGYELLVTLTTPDHSDLETTQKMVERQQVDGLIVTRTKCHDERIDYLLKKGIPFVVHGRTEVDHPPYAYLDIDGERAFQNACRHLVALGHRRIALLIMQQNFMFAFHRLQGYRRGLEEAGLAFDPQWVLEGDMKEEHGFQGTLELMKRSPSPTAILCGSDSIALGCLHALQQQGLVAGKDVSVIGYDNLPVSSYCVPPLTTMDQSIHEGGRQLVALLFAVMNGQPPTESQILWNAPLIIRESDGPCLEALT